jgi:hypothetical protein
MQHAHTKIPQADPPILPDAPEAIVPLVAPPRIKRHRRHPRVVPLAAGDQGRALGGTPDGDEVVLAARDDVLAVGGPADAGQAAVVGVVEVEESGVGLG